jgi:hypothetical protein
MNRARAWVGILALLTIAVIVIPATRSTRDRLFYSQVVPQRRVVIPARSYLTFKIVESVLDNGKAGETFEVLTAERVFADGQLAIPEDTRAALHIDRVQKREGEAVDVTVRVTELTFSNERISIDTLPLVATLRPMSAFNVMMRSAGELIGAAVGAAGRAVEEKNSLGVDALEGMVTASTPAHNPFELLRLRAAKPIDLTGVRW